MPMKLELKHITMQFGKKTALSDISLVLESGVYGLLGPNGAGKTTLIQIITNLLKPTNGEVEWDGIQICKHQHFTEQIGYLPQSPQFYSNFRGDEFLQYMALVKGVPKKSIIPKTTELLEQVNLTADAHRFIGQYSGGMRQRLGIAQALLNDPKLLILDEPTAGLDPKERIRFRNLISQLSANRIVLLATHIVSDIEAIAGHVILLKEGKVLRYSTPSELLAQMQGKVWEQIVNSADTARQIQPNISSLIIEHDRCLLRVIADQRPSLDAHPLTPRLEDVYLFYFGDTL